MRTDDKRYATPPVEAMDHRRRKNEQLYEADGITVRAVVALCEQRFWTELEEAGARERGGANVGGAIVGGLFVGILGHQVGGSTGRDFATVGAVVAGAALCANGGRDKNGQRVITQDVKLCTNNSRSSRPDDYVKP